ncbi:hypothetical protein M901_1918 [Bacteriovorax sp. DB6_IX]|nr:hypothetical protein M901_1918 [Bacteriovorax sp. DB6_IX]
MNYTQAGDVFHLIDLLSKRYENESSKLLYKYWSKKFPLSLEDNNQLDNFKKITFKV